MMVRIPSSPPAIRPLSADVHRPRWSVMIPVYNCSLFLPETLESVLQQAGSEDDMQIEVVDDASTDADVEAIVQRIGKGRIKYYRQPENRGSLRNFETCINRAIGHLVHILHGDDKVLNGYYSKVEALFRKFPEAGAAFCRFNYIDHKGDISYNQRPEMKQDGILKDWLEKIAEYQRIQYVAITVRREVYEKLGGFYGVTYGEDWDMWVRIAREYPVAYSPEILAEYRKHVSSISGNKFLQAENLKDMSWVMNVIQEYLPEEAREKIMRKSRKFYSFYGLRVANDLWHATHNKDCVQRQVQQALNLYRRHPLLYWKILKVYIKMRFNIL